MGALVAPKASRACTEARRAYNLATMEAPRG